MAIILSDKKTKKILIGVFKIFFGIIFFIGVIFLLATISFVILSNLPIEVKIALALTIFIGFFIIICLPIIIGTYLIIVPFYNHIVKGIKLEVIKSGINIGQRYSGPHNPSFEKNIYYFPLKKNKLFLNWETLKHVKFQKRKDLSKINKAYIGLLPLALLTKSLPSMLLLTGSRLSLSEGGYIIFTTKDNKKYIIDGNNQIWKNLSKSLEEVNKLNLLDT